MVASLPSIRKRVLTFVEFMMFVFGNEGAVNGNIFGGKWHGYAFFRDV